MRTLLLCTLGLIPSLTAQKDPNPVRDNPVESVEHLINEASIAGGIRFLADDRLEGRKPATTGGRLTQLYLATQFESFGLEKGGLDDTWEQPVEMVGIKTNVTKPFSVKGKGGTLSFTAPKDYTAEADGPMPSCKWDGAEVVFVGYGIHAPEQKWDDFKDVDVKGKVLLVMNNDPSNDPKLFAGKTRLYYGRWSYKYEEAARRGALGAIVIHTLPSAGYPFDVIRATQGRLNLRLPAKEAKKVAFQVRSWCSEEAARKICELGGKDLDALRASAEKRDFKPVALGVTASLETKNDVERIKSANVLAKLTGSDPELSKQAIVVTAHWDHLGRGRPRGEDDIYNGALDNASGTSAMLSIARAVASLKERPRRTIVFAGVTAEESGLLGSLYYARNPTFPRRQIVANFNIDGINIWGETTDIGMVGHGKNSLTDLAAAVAKRRGRELVPNPDTSLGLFYRSDHFSFARHGIPSAYFKAGKGFLENRRGKARVMTNYTTTRYHKPNDEFDTRWDLRGAVADTRLVLECLVRCANADEEPKWAKGDEFERLR